MDTDEDADEPSREARRIAVRENYGALAERSADGECCGTDATCCEPSVGTESDRIEKRGYDGSDATVAPEAAASSLGCGNPVAIDALEEGEAVVDLGSGGGFDCFLAAREVGPAGRVVGVDMTPEMLETARENASRNDFENVEFRLGEIEHLPAADASFDVVVSNCVVNLSPEKPRVFEEAYRVLRPGGRLAIADVVKTAELPPKWTTNLDAIAGCIGGAEPIDSLETMLTDAGFVDVDIEPEDDSEEFIREWDDETDPSEYLVSATISARKPA